MDFNLVKQIEDIENCIEKKFLIMISNDEELFKRLSDLKRDILLFQNPLHTGLSQDILDLNIEDNILVNRIEKEKDEIIVDIRRKRIKKTDEERMEEVENILKKSKIDVFAIQDRILQSGTVKECILSIRYLKKDLAKTQNEKLKIYAKMGNILIIFKKMENKDYVTLLHRNKINYTIQHVNSIIRFGKLAKEFPQILEYSISFRFAINNYALIKKIFKRTNE